MESVAKEIEENYNVETKIIVVDFTKEEGIYEKIEESIEGLEIGILVNNVGMCYEMFDFFTSYPRQVYKNLINCNMVSMINMTRIILPQMVDRKKGLMINLSSVSSVLPFPLLTVYAATKAFVKKFSDDLRSEYKSQGITIQTVSSQLEIKSGIPLKISGKGGFSAFISNWVSFKIFSEKWELEKNHGLFLRNRPIVVFL
jgi:17beta-estradiol 17-dehydrogenase / very-long-chain 3-oxoacyl-CoA reductase